MPRSLKKCTIWNVWVSMQGAPDTHVRHASRLSASDCDRRTANTWAVLSVVRTEDGRPGGFLQPTEPSSRHCLTPRRIGFGDGWGVLFLFISWRNPHLVSTTDSVRINSSITHTGFLTPPSFLVEYFQRSLLWLTFKAYRSRDAPTV